MTPGKRIREARKASGLSQEKLAELMGVSRQAVTKWEADKTSPTTDNLFRLADVLGTSVHALIGAEGQKEQPTAEQIYSLYKEDRAKAAAVRRARLICRMRAALAAAAGYAAIFIAGKLICCDTDGYSLLGWLASTGSRYYLFGWLLSSGMFWVSAGISVLAALLGKYRLSLVTLCAFVVGILLGEPLGILLGADAAYCSTHYGWAVWGGIFLASIPAGIVWEVFAKKAAKVRDANGK